MNYAISERMKQARLRRGISRQLLIDEINRDIDRPKERGTDFPKDLEFETYRRWEDGTNRVSLDWLPVLCRHLYCDIGYLFGEYEELTRVATDIRSETGLSVKALESLIGIYKYGPTDTLNAINTLLENEGIWMFLGHQAEEIEGKNPLSAIGTYLSGGNPTNGLILPNGERLHGENYTLVQALIDRTNLDAVQDSLKAVKKAASDG